MSGDGIYLLATVEDAEFQGLMRRLLAHGSRARPALNSIGLAWTRSVERNFDAGGRPNRWPAKARGGESKLQDTGRLFRSIHHRVLGDGVEVGTNDKKGRLHQLGGTIEPRQRRYLSIPVKRGAAYRAGAGAFFRRNPGRVYTVFRGDKGTVFYKRNAAGAGEPVFLLRKKVVVPARPFLLVQDEDVAEFRRILVDHLTRGLA